MSKGFAEIIKVEITQRGGKHAKVNDLVFNMYKSKFCEPALSEGFAEIVKVKITPTFRDKKKELQVVLSRLISGLILVYLCPIHYCFAILRLLHKVPFL